MSGPGILLVNGVELRKIPSAPNEDYRAGSDGQVYSRTRYKGFGRKEYVDWYPLKGTIGSRRYRTVSLSHKNVKVTRSVHTLICEAFHGTKPSRTAQVRHLDGTRDNNRPSNLAWGTQEENWNDRRLHGTSSEGERHWASKLTNEEREHIRWAIRMGLCSQRQAARALHMSQSAIFGIVHSNSDTSCG